MISGNGIGLQIPDRKASPRLNIVSMGSCFFVVQAFQEVFRDTGGIHVQHVGLSPDRWYSPVMKNGAAAYAAAGMKTIEIPRPSGNKKNFWETENLAQELKESYPAIRIFLKELLKRFWPDAFLLCDLAGDLEQFIVHFFKKNNIPIVYIEHGVEGHELETVREKLLSAGDLAGDAVSVENLIGREDGCVPNIYRCTYSPLSHFQPQNSRWCPDSICRATGYPYFDAVFRCRKATVSTVNNARILALSTGRGKFCMNDPVELEKYGLLCEVLEGLGRIADHNYRIVFRFKSREESDAIARLGGICCLEALDIKFDDLSQPSYEMIKGFDAVIGFWSTVLLEALILGVPVVMLSIDGHREWAADANSYVAQTIIKPPVIVPGMDYAAVLTDELAEWDSNRVNRRMREFGHLFTHSDDGRAGKRVFRVLLESVIRGQKQAGSVNRALVDAYSALATGENGETRVASYDPANPAN